MPNGVMHVASNEPLALSRLARWRGVRRYRIRADVVAKGSTSPSGVVQGIKCALSLIGVCDDLMAPPVAQLDKSERAIFKN